MKNTIASELKDRLQASDLIEIETIQKLWSGYGTIRRYRLVGSETGSVIVKHVSPPDEIHHPRGWNSDFSHQRKLKSYRVESAWYENWSQLCDASCRVPKCHALDAQDGEFLIALEDMDASGFPVRRSSLAVSDLEPCINWLANFHATFMNCAPEGLWDIGTYWHFDTRPDELARIQDLRLKDAAGAIDELLRGAEFQTFVHGDAKLANFCFSPDSSAVAAVDFQYVGGGCGMKDLAYFLGSCLSGEECERYEGQILDRYFATLREALESRHPDLDIDALEAEWRALYAPAWADFHRFLKGWSPGHWKLNSYEEQQTRDVLDRLDPNR